jgi:hypothetical protein
MAAKEKSGKGVGSSEDELRVAAAREAERKGLQKAKRETKPSESIKYTPAPTPVYFAERVRKDGAADSGERGPELFPQGQAKFEVADPKIERASEVERQFGVKVLNRGDYFNEYLKNIPGGAKQFVEEQKANYQRDDPDGYFADQEKKKNSFFGDTTQSPDRLIDFDKREKPLMVYKDLGKDSRSDRAHYEPLGDSVKGVDVADISLKDRVDEQLTKDGFLKQKITSGHLTGVGGRMDYNGRGPSSDENTEKGTLFHEMAHSFTSGAEVNTQIDEVEPNGADMENLEKFGTYNTSTNAEYAESALTGLNSMRSITGHKLNDPQSVHQLFDEIEANPKILNKVSGEGGRIFRSYFHLKQTNPWAAKKLREATARDSKYLAKNEEAPPSLEEQGRSLVANYFRPSDPLMG